MTNQSGGFDALQGFWNGQPVTQSQSAVMPVNPFTGQLSDGGRMLADALMGATTSPADVAGRIAKHAGKMGYSVSRDASNVSASNYLNLAHEALPDGPLKVRVSDHALPPSYGRPGDFDVIAGRGGARETGIGWAETLRALATRVGLPVPSVAQSVLTRTANKEATAKAAENAAIEARRIADQTWHMKPATSDVAHQLQMLAREFPDYAEKIAPNAPNAGRFRREVAALYEAQNPGVVQWVKSIDPRTP